MSETDNDQSSSRLAQEKGIPLAKLSMPRLAQGVARPRLFQVLDEGRKAAAVWIAAPGGAGKTTLAATYLLERQLPYLWYQLDADDADPATFFYYLGLAARQAASDQDIHLPLLTPEYIPDIPGFARRYFRDLYAVLPPGTVLVLDNYQDLGGSAIFSEILRNAIGEIPEGTHLLALSRSDPPPELVRHRATGGLAILDWGTVRLTREETQAIATHSHALDEAMIQALHQRAEGWPAGVTLLLEQIKRKGVDDRALGPGSLETVFHFFANEFFNELPETTRDFLLKTALLSHMTPTLAEQVSGNDEAGRILADLHRRHFFTNRRDLEEVSYQFHALFREFLLARAAESYTREQYLALIRLAGRLLSEHRRHEEAVALHLQAQDWETAIPLLLGQAPQLLAQGRAQIVAGWLQQMPEALVESVPWLLYWKGVSKQFVDPFVASDMLERAYYGFEVENDVVGQMLAASAIIDIGYFTRLGIPYAIKWVKKLQEHLQSGYEFPSQAIEARILTSFVSQGMFVWPDDAKLPFFAIRLVKLLDSDIDVNQKVFMAAHLLYYYSLILGDREQCEQIMIRHMPLLNAPELTVVNEIFWRCMCILPYTLAGEIKILYEIAHPASELVENNNLVFLKFIVNVYETLLCLLNNDTETAKRIISGLQELIGPNQSMDQAWYYWVDAWASLMSGDYTRAAKLGLASCEGFIRFMAPACEMEMRCLVANSYSETGHYAEALENLAIVKNHGYSATPRMRYQVLLIEAYISILSGNRIKGHTLLNEALDLGRDQRYLGNFIWFPRMMARLCAEALRADIEVDYVRQLIRKRKLLPEEPVIEDWPWAVRIFTLGHFKVEIDGQVITETRAQRKPLALLEVLVALGGAEVKIDRIAEILWPDAEGDAAISSFTTTVSRLRKLIGDEAIIVKGGRVSLDERRCWLDVRALERQFDRARKIDKESAAVLECAEKMLELYRGPFLSDEEGGWSKRPRLRLRESVARCLAQCVIALRASDERETASRLVEKAMDVDPEVVNRCHELMMA